MMLLNVSTLCCISLDAVSDLIILNRGKSNLTVGRVDPNRP